MEYFDDIALHGWFELQNDLVAVVPWDYKLSFKLAAFEG